MSAGATSQKYGTIVTATGRAAIANAVATNTLIDIKYISVGDGGGIEYYPSESQTTLKNQVYQMPANSVYVDPDNPNWIIVQGLLPESAGGFTIREIAIKTEDGKVIAIAPYPSTYKPKLEEGSAVGIGFKFIMEVTNADVVNMNIDPSTVYATIFYVDSKVSNHSRETNAHGGTYAATPSRLMHRNEEGRCQVADPKIELDAVNLKTLIFYVTGFMGDILPWDEKTTYDPLPWIVWGDDNVLHIAVQPSGPGAAAGPQDPTTTEGYWLTLAKYLAGGGGGSADLVYPGAFHDFMEQMPPSGWMVRNGALVTNASLVVPELLAALQKPENGWKLLSESEWQAQSAATPWNGIGGVAKFVLDVTMDTIRLPDTRGMYAEPAGFNNLSPGGAHGDAIRNITGRLTSSSSDNEALITGDTIISAGALSVAGSKSGGDGTGGSGITDIIFNASNVVPVAPANMPRAFGVLGCVYIGSPAI